MAESYLNVDRRYEDGRRLLVEAVAINRSLPTRGDLLVESLQSLGRANRFLGRHADDEQAQREAYEISRRIYGPSGQRSATQHAIWAVSLVNSGRLEDAYRESRQALADMRRFMPTPASPLLFTSLSAAFQPACLTGRYVECEALAREAIRSLGPSPAPADLRFNDSRAFLGLSLLGQGKAAEGRPLLEASLHHNQSIQRRPAYTEAAQQALANAR
jgi:hypothetical protein